MRSRVQLWPEEPVAEGDRIEVPAVLEDARGGRFRVRFHLPAEARSALTGAADPFVVATVFHVLAADADLVVHGSVSPSLLRGLEEFQTAWCRWRPEVYRPFAIHADREQEVPRASRPRTAMTFSGGLDSCCTAWRHTRGELGRRGRKLDAALMVHGFDVPLEQADAFAGALGGSRAVLASVGVPLIPVATNLRDLRDSWEDLHGAALAAVFHLVAGRYTTGLIASSHTYDGLRLPWGSNPLTDPLLGSEALAIVHDACELTRWEKADLIADWAAACAHLRVCWEGSRLDRNCGSCMRCVGTALCFAAMGRGVPSSIPIRDPVEAVTRLPSLAPGPVQLAHLANMARTARDQGLDDGWIDALEQFVGDRGAATTNARRRGWGALRRRLGGRR